ncbi:MAG: alpha/beta fold hydrolase [Henriciella sp.]|nr:alpha/beta fold hydrolase [Henriciella sp.]
MMPAKWFTAVFTASLCLTLAACGRPEPIEETLTEQVEQRVPLSGVPISATIEALEKHAAFESNAIIGGRVNPIWIDGGPGFLFSNNGPGDLSIFRADPETGSISQLTDDSDVRDVLGALGATSDAITLIGLDLDAARLLFSADGLLYSLSPEDGSARAEPDLQTRRTLTTAQMISDQFPTTFGPMFEAKSPDGTRFVTVIDHNLFVRASADGALRQLTFDGTPLKTWLNAQESAPGFNVHWSPDGNTIAATKLDLTDVPHEPVQNWLDTPPTIQPIPYPRSGEPMHGFEQFIIDVETGRRTPIVLGDTTDHYVDLLGWRSDGGAVFLRVNDRTQQHLRFLAADPQTGQTTLLHEERRETYIDIPYTLSPQLFFPLSTTNGFLYLTERTGWRQIDLHDESGRYVQSLTQGDWEVRDIVGVDELAGFVYFRASQDADEPYHMQLYRVPLSGGEAQLLTAGVDFHEITLSPDKSVFLAHRSATGRPMQVELRRADGSLIATLSTADHSDLYEAGFGGVERFTAPALGGFGDQHGVIYKPYDFDPDRTYPVVEFIYGGMQYAFVPHDDYDTSRRSRHPVLRALTGAGYVVIIVDAPGTPGRGRAFQDATYGIWPQTVVDNHVQAIKHAASTRPWMDLNRVGIFGHSWGGYLAQRAMIDAPDFYRAAASHAAPSDFYDHPIYIEPFMGGPDDNPEGYEAASNLLRIDEVQGPILSVPAPFDVNAGFTPGMKLVDAMIDARKEVELFSVPGSHHRLSCCSRNDELYKSAVIARFLERHLNAD